MEIGEIIKYLETWMPPGASWERDNSGLQAGDKRRKLKNVFLCLELSAKALNEAISKDCNLIITHHPLIFNPLKSIDIQNDNRAKLINTIIKNDITLYSAHTNLDFTKGGVSFELAKVLKLKDVKFLENLKNNQLKMVVFVPEESLKKVSSAMFNAGAGEIGEYSECGFSQKGTGTFKGSENSNPVIGKKQVSEKVEEIRLEVLLHAWDLNNVINAMIKAHPYEEPAYDVIPLKNRNVNFGMGAVGMLDEPVEQNAFLEFVCKQLNTKNIRYSGNKNNKIQKVAVCGGSGSDLVETAIKAKADAYITADIKYHTFQDAEDKILLIDAGHYETEIHSLNTVKNYLEKYIAGKNMSCKVLKFRGSTNPVKFYNN